MIEIEARLDELKALGLHHRMRLVSGPQGPHVVLDGKPVLVLSSENYLGLADHPRVREAAAEAAMRWGVSTGASRLACGTMTIHRRLEERLAEFARREAALLFGSGFLANTGVVAALARPGDIVFCDELSHPSILDGCRLSGAELFAYDHCDVEHLAWGIRQADGRGALVATDSVFSVDGDVAPLLEVVEVAARHRLRLMVDESHGIGALGPGGRGAVADTGLEDHVDVIVGTLGNALGSYGGFVACDRPMARYLVSAARTLQFSAAPSPPAVGGALAALDVLQQRPRLVDRLRANACALRDELGAEGFDMSDSPTQILSIVVGDPRRAVRICEAALERGVFAQTVRPPAVAPGWSRLRLAVSASHRPEELRVAARILGQVARAAGFEPAPAVAPELETADRDEPQFEPSRGVFDFEARAA
jgi:8-amino-7-oxononanoate synthase